MHRVARINDEPRDSVMFIGNKVLHSSIGERLAFVGESAKCQTVSFRFFSRASCKTRYPAEFFRASGWQWGWLAATSGMIGVWKP